MNIPFVTTLRITKDGVSGYATRIIHAGSRELLHANLRRRIPKFLAVGETYEVVAVTTLWQLQEQHH